VLRRQLLILCLLLADAGSTAPAGAVNHTAHILQAPLGSLLVSLLQ
jgi:hypothetical protein